MGLFDRFFKKDPAEDLRRAKEQLAAGRPVDALNLANRLRDGGPPELQSEAEVLCQQAHDQILQGALHRAEEAEQAGLFEEAADWARTALEHAADDQQAEKLEALARSLDARSAEAPGDRDQDLMDRPGGDDEDEEDLFWSQVAMLEEEVAERYEGRSNRFRQAVVAMAAGRQEEAEAAFTELLERDRGDAVLHFERGRCRLLAGELEGAREDLEVAWEGLGDAPLDSAGSLSVPALWGEAMLGLERYDEMLEQLEPLADPDSGDDQLILLYGQALMASGRPQPAADLLAASLSSGAGGSPEVPRHLALALDALGQRPQAIAVLEASIAPSCATGQCAKPPKHLPSFRLLAKLHLDDGGEAAVDRAGDLLEQMDRALGGRSGAVDQRLMARYYQLSGDPEAAAEALERARDLEERGLEEVAVSDQPKLQATQRRPL